VSELRWHPLLEEWVITATHRQDRTFLPPPDFCPLCPTKPGVRDEEKTEVPADDYDIVVFQNRFPSFQDPPPKPAVGPTGISQVRPAQGICEVVLYTPDHCSTLAETGVEHIRKLIEVWADRYEELGARDFAKFVLIFENKGKEIGVTLTHPHGQIYAAPYLPPVLQKELDACRKHFEKRGRCLVCDIAKQEAAAERLVAANRSFLAAVPFHARYPYEVHVFSTAHKLSLLELANTERWDLAEILKTVLRKYDNLWRKSLPYMMVLHQAPTDGGDHGYYHFHVEFYPPYRTREKLKYLAGWESGAGTYINDTLPEEKAQELRETAPVTVLGEERGKLSVISDRCPSDRPITDD